MALIQGFDQGVCIVDLIADDAGRTVDFRFVDTNEAFDAHTGKSSVRGRLGSDFASILDLQRLTLLASVADSGVSQRFETLATEWGGWFEVFVARVGAPERRRVALVFGNVDARKEADLKCTRALEAEQEARRRAEEAVNLRDEFLSSVSHELRTPLNAITGWVELLKSGRLAPDKYPRALEAIGRSARTQTEMVDHLLDFGPLLAGRLRIQVAPVTLHEVIESALETLRPAAEAKGVRLQPVLTNPTHVMGDAARLQQVIWNVLSNAVKFTPRGGRVHIATQIADSSVEVVVADTGAGIPSAFLPHVFERYRQADTGTTRAHGGLGLGLATARYLVELHGGRISVTSEGEGRGTTLTVRLPVAATIPDRSTSTSKKAEELTGHRIVIVDDEQDIREMLQEMLELEGASVRAVGTAREALDVIQGFQPDLVLSDIGMPREDGYWLIRQLRARPAEQGGKVAAVALTAFAGPEDRARALRAGFAAYLTKPVAPSELIAVLASLLSYARS